MIKNSSTLVVSFSPWAQDSEIKKFFGDLKLENNRVSSILKRYAVEVLPGTEDKYFSILQNNDLVSNVCEECLYANKKTH